MTFHLYAGGVCGLLALTLSIVSLCTNGEYPKLTWTAGALGVISVALVYTS